MPAATQKKTRKPIAASTKPEKPKMRKITVIVPADLLDRAMEASGEGITPTVAEGLEKVAVSLAYKDLLAMRGKIKIRPLPWLRDDR
ncbi:MAG: hypothetical protein SFV18_02445 [Bryobacteraceae bacterium]|nr:hypothetical protein [Bryobacteraceae bacterium]